MSNNNSYLAGTRAMFDASLLDPGLDAEGIRCRPLQWDDYDRGIMALLGQLTVVGDVTQQQFKQRFDEMRAANSYYTIVFEDESSGRLVGAGTVFIERKFIRNCGKVGHIEDIVVDKACRGKRLGWRVIQQLKQLSARLGAYKVILDCSEENQAFYEKCGLKRKEVEMVWYVPVDDSKL